MPFSHRSTMASPLRRRVSTELASKKSYLWQMNSTNQYRLNRPREHFPKDPYPGMASGLVRQSLSYILCKTLIIRNALQEGLSKPTAENYIWRIFRKSHHNLYSSKYKSSSMMLFFQRTKSTKKSSIKNKQRSCNAESSFVSRSGLH
jgi:hypothetical protein